MSYFEIGSRIRKFREKNHLSQDELAELASIHRVTLARYETGRVDPGSQQIGRIADALGVSVDELFGRTDPAQLDEEQSEAWAIRERLRRDPNYRVLFDAADNATPEHLRAAAAMLKALEPEGGDVD